MVRSKGNGRIDICCVHSSITYATRNASLFLFLILPFTPFFLTSPAVQKEHVALCHPRETVKSIVICGNLQFSYPVPLSRLFYSLNSWLAGGKFALEKLLTRSKCLLPNLTAWALHSSETAFDPCAAAVISESIHGFYCDDKMSGWTFLCMDGKFILCDMLTKGKEEPAAGFPCCVHCQPVGSELSIICAEQHQHCP